MEVADMTEQSERAARFLELHHRERPLLLPNPWDRGSAVLLASLGFPALATTSSGFAATLGRPDGSVTRQEAIAHAAQIVQATDLPVTADLENGFADDPAGGGRDGAAGRRGWSGRMLGRGLHRPPGGAYLRCRPGHRAGRGRRRGRPPWPRAPGP